MTAARRLAAETLSGHYLAMLCQHMASKGVSAKDLLAGTQLAVEELERPDVQVPLSLCLMVFANAQRLAPDPALGRELA